MNNPAPSSASIDLYNFAPVLELLFFAATLAFLVFWLWQRHVQARGIVSINPNARLQSLCLVALFLCFDLIVVGAFTRLTDSGLGCPDWPGCYGQSNPFAAYESISAEQTSLPDGPVTHAKAWIEMVHRYWAMTLGAIVFLLAALTWRAGQGLGWALFSAFWVVAQGMLGLFTVTLKLQPLIVTLHLLGGLVLLLALRMQYERLQYPLTRMQGALFQKPPSRIWLYPGMLVLCLQIALGAWVSSNYAVLACSDYPLCQGAAWPAMDFTQGFALWRDLGKTSGGELLSQEALVAIHFAHRWFAVVVALFLGWCAWRYRKAAPLACLYLALAVGVQWLTGLSNVVLGWPMLAALLHSGGSAMLALLVLHLILVLGRG